ncbi:hypothetical protein CRE_03058 [Caenorhabditis remanei]|uniref:Uncharacterized protein n=1 Tax=Caenorhabditis remanei TaxID=31234 RepID=E3LWC5_CAERE|nr:hypothetical protein CRE_03058 [Caenorhabditis remanei]
MAAKFTESKWKRVTVSEYNLQRRTDWCSWVAEVPGTAYLYSPNYGLISELSHKIGDHEIRYFLMDAADMVLVNGLQAEMGLENWKNVQLETVGSLRLWSEAVFKHTETEKKNFVIRSIPPIIKEKDGEEATVFMDEVVEIIQLLTKRRGQPVGNDFLGTAWRHGELKAIPLSQFKTILELYDIDKSCITIVDDPAHAVGVDFLFGKEDPLKVPTDDFKGILSTEHVVLTMVKSLVCPVNWRTATVIERQDIYEEINRYALMDAGTYIPYDNVVYEIKKIKKEHERLYSKEDDPLLTLRDRPPLSPISVKHYNKIASAIGMPPVSVSRNKCSVWYTRMNVTIRISDQFLSYIAQANSQNFNTSLDFKQALIRGLLWMVPNTNRVKVKLDSIRTLGMRANVLNTPSLIPKYSDIMTSSQIERFETPMEKFLNDSEADCSNCNKFAKMENELQKKLEISRIKLEEKAKDVDALLLLIMAQDKEFEKLNKIISDMEFQDALNLKVEGIERSAHETYKQENEQLNLKRDKLKYELSRVAVSPTEELLAEIPLLDERIEDLEFCNEQLIHRAEHQRDFLNKLKRTNEAA